MEASEFRAVDGNDLFWEFVDGVAALPDTAEAAGATDAAIRSRAMDSVRQISAMLLPASMQGLLAAFDFLAMDVVAETNLPCQVGNFDYFVRVKFAVLSPIVLMALVVSGGVLWKCRAARRRGWGARGVRRHHVLCSTQATVLLFG